jgi:hypothetical protein
MGAAQTSDSRATREFPPSGLFPAQGVKKFQSCSYTGPPTTTPRPTMLKTWQYFCLIAVGAVSLVLVGVNASLVAGNRAQQAEINQRVAFLQQSTALETLFREMVKALADLAVRSNDRRLLEALKAQGVNVTVNPSAAASDAAPKK